MLAGSQLPLGSVTASVASRAPLARSGSKLDFLRFGAGVQNRIGREHRGGEIGRAKQRAAELLGNDAKLDHAETRRRRTAPGMWMPGSASSSLSWRHTAGS